MGNFTIGILQGAAGCHRVMQGAAKRVLQGAAGCHRVLQGAAGSVLQGAAGCCRVPQGAAGSCRVLLGATGWCGVLQGAAGCCRVLQGAVGCCRVLQGAAGCCRCRRVLQGVVGGCRVPCEMVCGPLSICPPPPMCLPRMANFIQHNGVWYVRVAFVTGAEHDWIKASAFCKGSHSAADPPHAPLWLRC